MTLEPGHSARAQLLAVLDRLGSLSRKGLGLVRRSQREAWPAIEAAVAQACAGLRGDLLAQLAALEDELVHMPLLARLPS